MFEMFKTMLKTGIFEWSQIIINTWQAEFFAFCAHLTYTLAWNVLTKAPTCGHTPPVKIETWLSRVAFFIKNKSMESSNAWTRTMSRGSNIVGYLRFRRPKYFCQQHFRIYELVTFRKSRQFARYVICGLLLLHATWQLPACDYTMWHVIIAFAVLYYFLYFYSHFGPVFRTESQRNLPFF